MTRLTAEEQKTRMALEAVVKAAPRRAHFALALPGDTDDDPVILVHRTRPGPKMLRKAEARAKSRKSTCGRLDRRDGKVQFHCDTRPPQGLRMRLRKVFRKYGVGSDVAVFPPKRAPTAPPDASAPQQDAPIPEIAPETAAALRAAAATYAAAARKLAALYADNPAALARLGGFNDQFRRTLARRRPDVERVRHMAEALADLARRLSARRDD